MADMLFRLAKETELDAVYGLYRSVLGREFCVWNEHYPGWEEIREDHKTGNLFVLVQDGDLLGAISIVPENELDHLSCWQTAENCCEIARVAVSPIHQGQGLAGHMVQSILPILQAREYRAIHLSAAKANLPALKTYQKAGFTTVGEAPLFGGSYCLMEKGIGK